MTPAQNPRGEASKIVSLGTGEWMSGNPFYSVYISQMLHSGPPPTRLKLLFVSEGIRDCQ